MRVSIIIIAFFVFPFVASAQKEIKREEGQRVSQEQIVAPVKQIEVNTPRQVEPVEEIKRKEIAPVEETKPEVATPVYESAPKEIKRNEIAPVEETKPEVATPVYESAPKEIEKPVINTTQSKEKINKPFVLPGNIITTPVEIKRGPQIDTLKK